MEFHLMMNWMMLLKDLDFDLASDDAADVLGLSTGEMLELEFLKGAADEYLLSLKHESSDI
jgi:hypothetical protein